MAKKSAKLPLIYLIGMVLVVIGFCVPMFRPINAAERALTKISGSTITGFDFFNFDDFGFTTVGALLIFIGAICGVVFSFVPMKQAALIRLICLAVCLIGAVVLFVGFNQDKLYKWIGKGFIKHAFVGFYMIICGWAVGLVGWILKK